MGGGLCRKVRASVVRFRTRSLRGGEANEGSRDGVYAKVDHTMRKWTSILDFGPSHSQKGPAMASATRIPPPSATSAPGPNLRSMAAEEGAVNRNGQKRSGSGRRYGMEDVRL